MPARLPETCRARPRSPPGARPAAAARSRRSGADRAAATAASARPCRHRASAERPECASSAALAWPQFENGCLPSSVSIHGDALAERRRWRTAAAPRQWPAQGATAGWSRPSLAFARSAGSCSASPSQLGPRRLERPRPAGRRSHQQPHAGRERAAMPSQRLPDLHQLGIAQHPVAPDLGRRLLDVGGGVGLDQVAACGPAEQPLGVRQHAVGPHRRPVGDAVDQLR